MILDRAEEHRLFTSAPPMRPECLTAGRKQGADEKAEARRPSQVGQGAFTTRRLTGDQSVGSSLTEESLREDKGEKTRTRN